MENNQRNWSTQQQILRRRLMKDKDYRQALPVFLSQHAMVHSIKLEPDEYWSFQDQVLRDLTDAQMRHIPKGCPHSVAWAIWHITRIEDVTLNLLLADAPQVFHRGNWRAKLASPFEDVGNEMSSDEIARFSETVNLKALIDYRLVVGKNTRALVRRLNPEILWTIPASEDIKRILEESAVRGQAIGLLKYWGGHPCANLLLMPATRHCFIHLNEIQRMTPKLKRLDPS